MQLAQILYRDLLFRRFCLLELGGVPDAYTLGRFRARLLRGINRQLEVKRIIMAEGRLKLIDATSVKVVQFGSGKGKDGGATHDAEAGWYVKRRTAGTVSTPPIVHHPRRRGRGRVHSSQTAMPDNAHDSRERDMLLLGDKTVMPRSQIVQRMARRS